MMKRDFVHTRLFAAAALAMLAALAGTGCLGSTPQARLYAITAPPVGPPVEQTDWAVLVGPIDLPRYLDRPQIVTRTAKSPERLHVAELHRWAGGLSSDVARVLAKDLGQRLGTSRIVLYPANPPFPLDYTLTIEITRLDGELGRELVLEARFMLTARNTQEAIAIELFSHTETVERASYEDLVRAHGRALSKLSQHVAGRLLALRSVAD